MTPTEIRLRLRANGYHPIPALGKIPHIKGWQDLFDQTDKQIEEWATKHADHTNTSILAFNTPGLDIDVMDEQAVAHVVEFVRGWAKNGTLLRRQGMPPKVLIPFRTDTPFDKVTRYFGDKGKIEFLGKGQQYVVHGVHPDTGKPYEWLDGRDLVDVPRNQLGLAGAL